jgi:hypothetical protein
MDNPIAFFIFTEINKTVVTMKLIFTVLVATFMCLAAFGQKSNVIIQSENGERFTVVLNGEKKNKIPAAKVDINQIDAPVYKLKIIFSALKVKPILKTLTLEPGFNAKYLIKKVGKSYKIVLVNHSPVATTAKVTHIDSISGKEEITVEIPSPKVKTTYLPGYLGQIGCPRPINAIEFQAIRKSIMSKNMEEDKQKIARQLLNSNCFFTSQVKELLMLFAFEKARIEFAKSAFSHTYDIGNYNTVAEAFLFENSASELSSFIKENPKH